jgi:hypothetical protein
MMRKHAATHLAAVFSLLLATVPSHVLDGYQATETAPGVGAGGATDSAPLSASQLHALVAPIALYPDALVAQILSGATFPDQVAIADYWVQQHKGLTGSSLAQAVNNETWDPSVKALTAFPSVLHNMAQNLSWTSSLGEAFHNQGAAVMKAVQTLRAQAKAAGTLKSSAQITVTEPSSGLIEIAPTNPQVVYVPEYNPAVIYGVPYVWPGYTAADLVAADAIGFGAGIAVGALMGSAWGWHTWGCDWYGGAALYNHAAFYGNPAWHGAYYHGGYHYGGYGYANAYNRTADFNRTTDVNRTTDFNRTSGFSSTVNRSTSFNSSAWSHDAGAFGGDGWSSRASSMRGWGSMHAGGFGGGRFAGGGFGGGGFRGGGRR